MDKHLFFKRVDATDIDVLQICLKLAKDPKLSGDFKAQVARLTPESLATLQAGLRAAMAVGVRSLHRREDTGAY